MCTCPLPARRVNGQIEFLGRSEKERFSFGRDRLGTLLQIPCGQCTECRLKRSREWAVRCMHEALMHRENCFLTLTYDDKKGPVSPSLRYKDFQDFMKRLRWHTGIKQLGFFACGEYGETNPNTGCKDGGRYRPHFHCILFGFNFSDRVPIKLLGESELFRSDDLDRLWSHGACRIGEVTFESASYVARYGMKKVNGDNAYAVYDQWTFVDDFGEMHGYVQREPEMLHMSRRPAIGKRWFEQYGKHAVYHDYVNVRGAKMQPPRYYDKQLPDVIRGMLLESREKEAAKHASDHTDARNNVRAIVVEAGVNLKRRS